MATTPASSPSLYQRLLAVQKAVAYMRKDQQGDRFSFVGSSKVLGMIREAMDENGLILSVSVTGHTLLTKWGNHDAKEHLTELDLEFTWINVDDPSQTLVWHGYGQGLDTGEKGVGKALTYGEKYGLLKFFHIATDKDDPDSFQDRIEQSKPREELIGPDGASKIMGVVTAISKAQAGDNDENRALAKTALVEGVKAWARQHGVAVASLTVSQGYELMAVLQARLDAAHEAAAIDPTGTAAHATDEPPMHPDHEEANQ